MLRKGFTLVELLIVITVLGILAATILTVVNPQDKINAANDAKVQNDINQIINALQTYAAQDPQGYYPDPPLQNLVTAGEINVVPKPPTGYGTDYTYSSDNTSVPPVAKVSGIVKSKKNVAVGGGASAYWCWSSTSGVASILASCP
ncbi:MAG: type II secretion system protein [Patescibacteria group bacterium]